MMDVGHQPELAAILDLVAILDFTQYITFQWDLSYTLTGKLYLLKAKVKPIPTSVTMCLYACLFLCL